MHWKGTHIPVSYTHLVQNEEENSRLNGVEASKVKEISRQHQQMLLSELLQHGNISPIYAELCQSDATLAKAQYCMVLVCDLFFWPVQDTAFSNRLNVAAKKISHQLEEWNCGVLLYHTQTMGQIVILLYSEFSDAQRMIVQILEELSVSHGLYVGCSGCNPFPDALTQSYAEAQQAFLSAGPSYGRTLLVRYSAETPRVKVKTSIELENQMLSALLIGDNAAISNAVPVSYTHLDVYKRQVLCGISIRFQMLSPTERQVAHVLLTRSPLS